MEEWQWATTFGGVESGGRGDLNEGRSMLTERPCKTSPLFTIFPLGGLDFPVCGNPSLQLHFPQWHSFSLLSDAVFRHFRW